MTPQEPDAAVEQVPDAPSPQELTGRDIEAINGDAGPDAFAQELRPAPTRFLRLEATVISILEHMAKSSSSPVAPEDAQALLAALRNGE